MTTLALALVLLYLIAIPGFIAVNSYYTYRSETLKFKPTGSKFALAVIISIVSHLAWLQLVTKLGYNVSFPLIIEALSPASKQINGLKSWVSYQSLFDTGAYFVSLYMASFVLAKALQSFVLRKKWDLTLPFLSFENPLVYRLMGRTSDYSAGDFDGIIVSATVDHDDGTFLYTGFLTECSLDDNGEPKQLILQGTSRRKLANDKSDKKDEGQEQSRFYNIDGHYFVLEYSNVNTLNLNYVVASSQSDQDDT